MSDGTSRGVSSVAASPQTVRPHPPQTQPQTQAKPESMHSGGSTHSPTTHPKSATNLQMSALPLHHRGLAPLNLSMVSSPGSQHYANIPTMAQSHHHFSNAPHIAAAAPGFTSPILLTTTHEQQQQQQQQQQRHLQPAASPTATTPHGRHYPRRPKAGRKTSVAKQPTCSLLRSAIIRTTSRIPRSNTPAHCS